MGLTLDPVKTRSAIANSGRTLFATAGELGISHSHLCNVLAGRRRLGAPAALALAELLGTNIPALRA